MIINAVDQVFHVGALDQVFDVTRVNLHDVTVVESVDVASLDGLFNVDVQADPVRKTRKARRKKRSEP